MSSNPLNKLCTIAEAGGGPPVVDPQAKQLHGTNAELTALMETAAVGLHWLSADGIILWANQAEMQLLGYSRDEYVGHHVVEFHVDQDEIQDILEVLRSGQRVCNREVRLKCKGGSIKHVLIDSNALWDGETLLHTQCIMVDITQRKDAERALSESEQRYRQLVHSLPAAVYTCDAAGRITLYNRAAAELWGRKPQLGKDLWCGSWKLYRLDGTPLPLDAGPMVIALKQGRAVYGEEVILERPDGVRRNVMPYPQPLRDARGEVVGAVNMLVDVTEHRRTEAALRDNEELFRTLANSIPQLAWIARADGYITWYNQRWYEYTGTALQQVQGWGWQSVHDPKELPRVLEKFAAAFAAGQPWDDTFPLRRHDGEMRWHLSRAMPVRDKRGQITQWFGTHTDITDRLQSEETCAQLAAIVESSDDAIIGKTLDGIITTWNTAATRLYGYTAQEVIGKPITVIIPPDRLDEEKIILARLRRNERIDHYETVRRAKDGRLIDVSLTVSPIRDGSGRIIGASKIARDITERKRAEQALKDADRRKDEFLATLAHELRNPLAPMRNGLELIRRASNDPATLEQARAIMQRQLHQMVRLIDDLLDVSRITLGKLELRKQRVALSEVVQSEVEMCDPLIRNSGHQLTVTLPDAPVFLDADQTRMAQALGNLLSNAARYTPAAGKISLAAQLADGQVTISVKDNGAGIPPEMLGRIFDMFTQVDRSLERSQGGLGIGLTLAKQLVEMHDGTVEARSEGAGHGSEFIMRLPFVAVAVASPPDSPRIDSPPDARRVLVADDNKDSADSLALMLELMGNQVRTAGDGNEAVRVAEEFQPDVILLDIGMPGLNGYDAARLIRRSAWGRNITLAALTGWGMEEDKQLSYEAGFDHHIVKPIEPDALTQLLSKGTSRRAQASVAPPAAPPNIRM